MAQLSQDFRALPYHDLIFDLYDSLFYEEHGCDDMIIVYGTHVTNTSVCWIIKNENKNVFIMITKRILLGCMSKWIHA